MYKDNQDRIDAYLRGEMTSEERAEFEKDMNSDATLLHEYLETKAISDALADRKEKLTQMARWDDEEKLRLKILHRRKVIRRWTIGISAAACIAIGFFAVRPMFFTTSPYPSDGGVLPNYGSEAHYRSENSDIQRLDSIIGRHNYIRALAFTDSLINENRLLIAQYEPIDSLSEKEAYQKLQTEEYLYTLKWRKANILLKLNKTDEAAALLNELASKENVYNSQADSLLNTITQKEIERKSF